ncbi:hypothetical protein [Streptosporangium sp. NPDC001681]|uniref:hypothetical protein n=1 Tax=Streptosporangium sp. NPDC001681 TaxID=3154395 RepID=UPI0033258A78
MNELADWFRSLDIDWGDAPAFGALLVALLAYLNSRKTLRAQQESTKAQQENTEASVRSANAAEKAVALAELTARPPAAPAISWRIEPVQNALYRLRNTGDATATGVNVDTEQTSGIVQGLPQDAAIRSGGSVEFYIIDVNEEPFPGEIWMYWDGHPDPLAVPVPS